MADEGLRFEAWTMPHVGVLTRKFDFSKWVEQYTLNDRFNDLSDGTLSMPDDYPLKAQLFHIDEANHANDVGSMVRVLRGTTPILHYLVTRSEDSWSDGEPTHKLALEGLEWILDRVIVPNYDHPADPAKEPDWIYGAPSILQNTDFEAAGATNLLIHLWIEDTVTSGTWTITFPGQTTGALAWNIDITALQTAIEGLSNIQDIIISGDGTATNPWVIEVIDPAETDFNVSVNSAGLTGGVALMLSMIAGGAGITAPWTRSFNPLTSLNHGTYTNFDTSTVQAHTGTTSLYVKGAIGPWPESFPGAQQIVSVTGGRTYRAKVWIYPKFAATYRFVIRSTDETWIGSVEAALTANSWQEMSFSVLIPEHIQSIIFRVACISTGAVHEFYLDDALLAPGQDAATLGKMVDDVRTAAIAVASPLAWLVPTWTTTLDSDGVAWDATRMWNVNHGQSFLQLLEYCRKWNYEFRIRWDVADNRFEWDMWNPLAGGQVRANIAITGKSGVTGSAPIVKRPPGATYVKTEGAAVKGGLPWGEFASTTLDDVWGRLEKFHQDRQGVDSTELDELAERIITKSGDNTAARAVTVSDPSLLPWTAYEPGDTVTLNLAPKDVKKELRVAAIVASKGPNDAVPQYDVHFGAPVYSNDTAIAAGLRTLIREFRRPTPTSLDGTPAPPAIGGGKGGPSIMIAAADAGEYSKQIAHLQANGVNDTPTIQAAVTYLNSISPDGGKIVLSEGTFNCRFNGSQGVDVVGNAGISLVGTGRASTQIFITNSPTVADASFFVFSSWTHIADLTILDEAYDATFPTILVDIGGSGDSVIERCNFYTGYGTAINADARVTIRDCIVEAEQNAIYSAGDAVSISDCFISSNTYVEPAVHMVNGAVRWWLTNNYIFGGRQNLHVEDDGVSATLPALWHCVGNFMDSAGYEGILVECQRNGFSYNHIRGNNVVNCGQDVGAYTTRGAITVIGDATDNGLIGSSSDTEPGGSIVDNVVEGNPLHDGIRLINAHGTKVIGNHVEDVQGHGIVLEGTSDAVVALNQVVWYDGTDDNTYDCYLIDADSDRNHIHSNQAINGFSGTDIDFRYGFNINNANCAENVMVGNFVIHHHNAFGTGNYRDAGTGTQLVFPGAAAPQGDNFIA